MGVPYTCFTNLQEASQAASRGLQPHIVASANNPRKLFYEVSNYFKKLLDGQMVQHNLRVFVSFVVSSNGMQRHSSGSMNWEISLKINSLKSLADSFAVPPILKIRIHIAIIIHFLKCITL